MNGAANPISAVADWRLDYGRLASIAQRQAAAYAAADPFPHAVIDDLLPASVVTALMEEFPSPQAEMAWRKIEMDTDKGRTAQRGKVASSDQRRFGPNIRDLFWELNAPPFLGFLETLTGIASLIPDPHLIGGGIHQILPGGMLRVHSDFNMHPLYRLDRRLNVLIFLNPDWRDDYGGHLELWSKDMSRCVVKVLPIAGRCVVFSTTSDAFHGHPRPLTCPQGRTRKSLALYYYSNGRPEEERHEPHPPLWQELPEETEG